MSHMVIHTTADGMTQYRQFDDLGSAVQFVEEQRNAGIEGASLFEMREIPLAVKSYFKVEVAEGTVTDSRPTETTSEAAPVDAPAPIAAETSEPTSIAAIDDISYVEAAMASPIDAFAAEASSLNDMTLADPIETPAPAEGRRGLFGR